MYRSKRVLLLLLPVTAGVLLLHSCRDGALPTEPAHGAQSQISPITTGQEATLGQWTAPFAWPEVAVHLHLLPNGRILSFARNGQPQEWDPATGVFTERATGSNLFCSGHTFLADGRLLVTGGHITDGHGLPDGNIYDYATGTWTRVGNMARGRWYPTSTMYGNGDVVTVAGADQAGTTVPIPELLRSGATTFQPLTGASKKLAYYPRMFLAPNGKIFYAGQAVTSFYLDPTGTGKWTKVGSRLVANRLYGSAVMYEPGKVLYVGGGNPPTNTAEVIDLNQPLPAWRLTNPMVNPREFLNATLLPDGTVLATGGNSVGGKTTNGPVHAAELWDPATEQWRTLGSNQVIRVYHSTTLLLPDARVLHAGSGDGGGLPRELNAEIFSPPYLFDATGALAPRPAISNAPKDIGYGETFLVQSPHAGTIRQVTLLRLGSVTHAFDANQRFNRLNFTQDASGLHVTAPAGGNLAPPGHYLLFILNASGVPSVARILHLG